MSPRNACLCLIAFLAFMTRLTARGETLVRTDLHGDPLPEGAVARLGTVRWRGSFLGFTANGRVVCWRKWRDVCILDSVSGRVLRHNELPDGFIPCALSQDGKMLAATDRPSSLAGLDTKTFRQIILLWNVAGGKEIHRFEGTIPYAAALAFSPDGKTLASASVDKGIKLWDLATRKEQANLDGHTLFVSSVAYSPTEKILASGSGDDTIKLWDLETGKEEATLKGHTDRVYSVAYSPDGKSLVSASADGTIKLWDVETSKEQAAIKGHKGMGGRAWSAAGPGRVTCPFGTRDMHILAPPGEPPGGVIAYGHPRPVQAGIRASGGHALRTTGGSEPPSDT